MNEESRQLDEKQLKYFENIYKKGYNIIA